MYYTGLDPRTMEPVYVPKNPHEKALQRALIQYRDPKNREQIEEALIKAGREDLIGYGPKCLIRPRRDGQRLRGPGAAGSDGPNKKAGRIRDKAGTEDRPRKKRTIRHVHKKKQ